MIIVRSKIYGRDLKDKKSYVTLTAYQKVHRGHVQEKKKDKTGWHVQAEERKRANPPIRFFLLLREATDQIKNEQ
jgi:hypothetical protein